MTRLWALLTDRRLLSLLGLCAVIAVALVGLNAFELAIGYSIVAIVAICAVWFVVWIVRRMRARRAGRRFESALEQQAAPAPGDESGDKNFQIDVMRSRMLAAIKTIKTSKLGETAGSAALYELPWYMVLGNPAAGKSTAVVKSGLTFPFADPAGQVIQGLGGTRNCDWFFTSEGILLDTAGRYSVEEEDRREWHGFLALLKKHRPKAPINGVVIAASVAELSTAVSQDVMKLARSLRKRMQELTEELAIFMPVYVVFTKADLMAGFVETFGERDSSEREKVWGATFAYDPEAKGNAVALFDAHFEELHDGLKELSLTRMATRRGQKLPPGVLTFPLEFASMKDALSLFIATLFEENPYQFRPVFRGFYFTSALQDGSARSNASAQVAQHFSLDNEIHGPSISATADNGYFLKDLFSKVIFADRHLVRQFASRGKVRLRLASFSVAVLALALALGGWSWSYLGNRHLMADVRADLDKSLRLQHDRLDLASRFEALEVLQDRIEQLTAWRQSRPWAVGLGLYQGEEIEKKLRAEYFHGVRQIMLQPVATALEGFLADVDANAAKLQPMPRTPESAAQTANASAPAKPEASRFAQAAPDKVEDAYNALKTYLMFADAQRMEPGHLTDQITRFWRGWLESNRGNMPDEQLIRSAERMISFSMANLQDPDYPLIASNYGLVDRVREDLRRVVRGVPARERVYAEVKARAATRFSPVTVAHLVDDMDRDVVAGSYAVSGAFTREAWQSFIEPAFKDAATRELQSADWVLKTATRDDLTLEGSPDQIRKTLTDLYKTEYVHEWQRFMQGVSINDFRNFETAVSRMNRLGDAGNSPLKKLMTTLYEQTSWDNPSAGSERIAQAESGAKDWIHNLFMRQAPVPVNVNVSLDANAAKSPPAMGPVGREFSSLSRIMMARDNGPTLLAGYLEVLARIRSRFNQIKTQGDAGPPARQMMAGTLQGGTSELGDALKFIDEQMLVGMPDAARAALRPMLVRPLIQSFAVIAQPTETEINRVWVAQVYEPFQRILANRYPFDPAARIEATPQDIAKIFGPDGAVAKFTSEALEPFVVRRGDTVTPRTWADIGLQVRPAFSAGFARWVAPLDGAAAMSTAGAAGNAAMVPTSAAPADAGPGQTAFQILPQGAPGLTEYSISIDGQLLRYRNTEPAWTAFVWPNPAGVAGVRISAVTNDGRSIELFNEPGRFGFPKMVDAAAVSKLPGDIRQLNWTKDGQTVSVQFRMVSTPASQSGATATANAAAVPGVSGGGLRGAHLPALVVGAEGIVEASSAGTTTGAAR